MKTLVTLVLLTLLCFLRRSSAAPVAPSMPKDGCCPGFNQTQIPKGKIRHMGLTPKDCESKVIVITTVCQQKFCVDPDSEWAKNRLAEFQKTPSNFNRLKCVKKL